MTDPTRNIAHLNVPPLLPVMHVETLTNYLEPGLSLDSEAFMVSVSVSVYREKKCSSKGWFFGGGEDVS